jgi:hypothetical protein
LEHQYETLTEAHEALDKAQYGVGYVKLEVGKIVRAIRAGKLYTQHMNSQTGQPCATLDEYLKDRNEDLKRISGLGARSIRRLLKSLIVYCDELSLSEEWLLDMGEHANELIELAHVGRDLSLQDDDKATPGGGTYLGRYNFLAEATAIAEAVAQGAWKIKDTRELVADRLGKQTATPPKWTIEAIPISDTHARVKRIMWELDGQYREFRNDDLWPIDALKVFATKEHMIVDGIEGLADTQLH